MAVTAIDELSEEALQAALSATLRAEYWIKILIATQQIPEEPYLIKIHDNFVAANVNFYYA